MVESPSLPSPPYFTLPTFPLPPYFTSPTFPLPPSPRCSLLPASLSCSLLQRLARDYHLHTSTSLTVDLAQVLCNGLYRYANMNILLLFF